MTRFFFDFTSNDSTLYDYGGEQLLSHDDAYDFALATAEVLRHSQNENWSGWSVNVRDAEGKSFFSLPIGH